jgi:hypothetical protein
VIRCDTDLQELRCNAIKPVIPKIVSADAAEHSLHLKVAESDLAMTIGKYDSNDCMERAVESRSDMVGITKNVAPKFAAVGTLRISKCLKPSSRMTCWILRSLRRKASNLVWAIVKLSSNCLRTALVLAAVERNPHDMHRCSNRRSK